jgi:hypothetical protein
LFKNGFMTCVATFSLDYSQSLPVEPRIEYFRSFSVVPLCEAFASLLLKLNPTIGKKNRSNTLPSVVAVNLIDHERED